MTANPGISMPEAVVRMNAHNAALAKGINPSQMVTLASVYGMGAIPGLGGGLLGEGGPMTKPHREL